jgi:hypothetical protein
MHKALTGVIAGPFQCLKKLIIDASDSVDYFCGDFRFCFKNQSYSLGFA